MIKVLDSGSELKINSFWGGEKDHNFTSIINDGS